MGSPEQHRKELAMSPMRRDAAAFPAVVIVCVSMLSLAWLCASNAHAETYFGGMLGGAFPNKFSDVQDGMGDRYSDLKMKNSAAAGVKLGHYFSKAEWLGLETELFAASPKFKVQTVPGTGPNCPCSLTTSDSSISTLTWAFNAVVRYPGEKFQPYAGAGLGLFFADLRSQGAKADNAVPGLNALAGARYFVTKDLALFGEYKYNRASFTFDQAVNVAGGGTTALKGDYSVSMFVVGLSLHFK
jgi:opacity protein-like surface antigen